jgi:alanine racemase
MKDEEKLDGEARASHEDGPASSSSDRPPAFDPTARRPTWAEINLGNLVHNFREVKTLVGPGCAIMPAVKADAYGHGAAACARALERAGADWFGVALPEEGAELRDAGVSRPILCLGSFWEGQEEGLIAHSLTPAIFRLDLLDRFDRAARSAGRPCDYHLKVDTGMGRLGVPLRELEEFLDGAERFQNVRLDGVMTHFASADDPDHADFTRRQIAQFESAVEQVRARGLNPSWIHQANSAAFQAYSEARGNLVRVGGVVYGLWRDVTSPLVESRDWRPVMSLHTRITYLKRVRAGSPLGYGGTFVTRRESLIATLPVGYADGLRRELSNRGRVLVRGQSAPIVGRISMDLTLIDVTDISGAAVGDETIILGRQGEDFIAAEEIAGLIGTISYEVTCAIGDRVPRESGESGESW